jgi:glycosyltransferase 2 family protein
VPKPSASSRIHRSLRVVLGVVVFVGVALALRQILRQWDGGAVHVRLVPVVLSVLVLLVANFLQAFAWLYLLQRMAGKAIPIRPAMTVFMAGQLARYVPGKVGLPMVRIAGAPRIGISANLIAASVGIEVATWLAMGTLVGCVALLCNTSVVPMIPSLSRTLIGSGLAVVTAGLAAALLLDRNQFPKWVLRLLHAEGVGPFVTLRVVAMQLLAWIGWWILGFLVPLSVGVSVTCAMRQAAIFIVAPILGFMAMVAPGGLGVRETVISVVLAPHVGASAALAAAVLARGAALASEVACWVIALVWERRIA